jgi:hypothetical protein
MRHSWRFYFFLIDRGVAGPLFGASLNKSNFAFQARC